MHHLHSSINFFTTIFTLGLMAIVFGSFVYLAANVNINSNFYSLSAISFKVSAQPTSDKTSSIDNVLSTNGSKIHQSNTTIVKASGHFANNQIENDTVAWIEGGLWNLDIEENNNNNDDANASNISNITADFNANFTMIKPDGSLSHNHTISNFKSDAIIFAGNDLVITGNTDILTDNEVNYTQVPITVHLMGKKVLGLMIDVNRTGGHFAGSNEMFGTLISGIGLDNSTSSNNNSMINNYATTEFDNSSIDNSMMSHMMH